MAEKMKLYNSPWLWVPLGACGSPYRRTPAEPSECHQRGSCLRTAPRVRSANAAARFVPKVTFTSLLGSVTLANQQLCAISGADFPAPGAARPRMASSAREQDLLAAGGILIKQGEKWGLAVGQMP